jgi:signal peptidase I
MDVPETKKAGFLQELLTFAVVALVIVVPIRLFIAQPFIVSGESMYPTFDTGQYLIVDQLSYRFNEPARGDVIIFRYPNNPSTFFIKRVIGLPGETLNIEGNTTTVTDTAGNKTTLTEPYVQMPRESILTTTLADDEYFVMGDNRLASLDSRTWGPLKRDHIIGRAYVRLLPFDTLDFLPGSIN